MNMKIIYGAIAMLVIILGLTNYLAGINNNYSSTADLTGFQNTEALLNDLYQNTTSKTESTLQNGTISEEDISSDFSVIKLGITGAKTSWKSLSIFKTLFADSWNILIDSGILPQSESGWLLIAIFSIFGATIIIWFITILVRWYV